MYIRLCLAPVNLPLCNTAHRVLDQLFDLLEYDILDILDMSLKLLPIAQILS
jgi:aspartate/glutamate racemase